MHLVISANEQLYHARYNEADKLAATGGVEITWPVPYWFVDAGALMMLVLAAAIDEGLASAFIGHPDQKRIFDELLGLPPEVVPIGLGADRPARSRRADRRRGCGNCSARWTTSSTGSAGSRRYAAGSSTGPYFARTSSTNAASSSAIAASSISSTFSAFRSPLRERLNEPTNTVSSQTRHLRVHEVVHRAVAVRRRLLAGERAGHHVLQQRQLPRDVLVRAPLVDHLADLRRVDAAGEIDRLVGDHLRERAEHRAGRDHRRADPHALPRPADQLRDPDRRSSPCPGVIQARIPSSQRGSTNPLCATSPVVQSWSKSIRNAFAIAGEWTIATTFSCRDHESSVQFSDPVQTDSPSRITYLWCIRSGMPAIAFPSTGSVAISVGVGLGRRRHRDRVRVVDVVGESRLHAARGGPPERVADDLLRGLAEVEVVLREVERALVAPSRNAATAAAISAAAGRRPSESGSRCVQAPTIEEFYRNLDRSPATIPTRRTPVRLFLRMKTYNAKPGEIERDWLIVDAEGKTLGRLATQIAERLRGKGKTVYTPHVDTGDFVVVVNAEKIAVTGNKLDEKMYYRHSGYPGGLRERTLRQQLERQPTEVLRKAVKGMLPRNKLGRAQLTKLKIYVGPDHPHAAQAPKTLEV